MPSVLHWLLRRILTLDPREVTGERRGFASGAPEVRERLDAIGRHVLDGQRAALELQNLGTLRDRLDGAETEVRGFAYEGAALGLALRDLVLGRELRSWREFRERHAERHDYMVHVGAGLAFARLRRRLQLPVRGTDPLLGALVADGYGFHEGFFATRRAVHEGRVSPRARGLARRGFDQGLGRSLWFVCAADPDGIAAAVARFAPSRQGDLWSGIGLACAYAGGLAHDDIARLQALAGDHGADLAQGAAFAAEARARAGNVVPHTQAACAVLCRCDAGEAAARARSARVGLTEAADGSAYEQWRGRLRATFACEEVVS